MTPTVDRYHMNPETHAALMAEVARRREDLAARRLLRASAQTLDVDLGRLAERRSGEERRASDRAGSDRRFGTMQDKLAAEAQRQSDRRFSVVPHSALMGLDS